MLEVFTLPLIRKFSPSHVPEPIIEVDDIAAYSEAEGLALKQRRNMSIWKMSASNLDANSQTAKCLDFRK